MPNNNVLVYINNNKKNIKNGYTLYAKVRLQHQAYYLYRFAIKTTNKLQLELYNKIKSKNLFDIKGET